MIINIYGVPANLLIKWILNYEFSKKGGIQSWVDLGCGNGLFLKTIGVLPYYGLGVDILKEEPSLPPNFLFERGEVSEWLDKNKESNFDLISMFELVEHIEKNKSIKLINKAGRMAKSLLISTPAGFLKQDAKSDPTLKDNPWQWHRCGFTTKEFEKMNFICFVLKYYHLRPNMIPHSYDELVAYKRFSSSKKDYSLLVQKIILKSFIYNLNPLHLYRTLRQFKRHKLSNYDEAPKITDDIKKT